MLLLSRRRKIYLWPEHFNKKQTRTQRRFWASRVQKEMPFSTSTTLRSMEAVRKLGEAILHSASDVVDTAAESLWIPR
jgi:hypothetical protein